MSKELLDFLNAQGLAGLGVIIIGAGTVVAAIITALNAWAVAWFNARATRQLAIDAAHRELRKKLVEKALVHVHKIQYAAEDLKEALASDRLEDAKRLLQAAPTVHSALHLRDERER